ncbi:hypothetical protein ACIBCM_00100 [Streptomyces sp. NPDC051018]|uniref:hypothetical protein n=1 Tax=Streptomyces sp. NPDC051018 TaxID=3365639 RepID=UPI003799FB6E
MKPHRKSRSSPPPSGGLSRPVQGGLTVAAFVLVPLLAVGASDGFRAALDHTTGVLSLVSLTAAIAWGLIATDRLLLSPRHRLLAQAVHRATATASLGFLLLHATVKVSLGHVGLIGAMVPFGLGAGGTAGLIGFGSLAGFLMVVAGTTGALRSALAGNVRGAGRWRPLHMLAYPAWCFALVHGLFSGRPAAAWVVTMYCLALLAVAAAVSIRLLPRPVQRRLSRKVLRLTGGGSEDREGGARRDTGRSLLPDESGGPVASVPGAGEGPSSRLPYETDLRRETAAGPAALAPPRRRPTLAAPSPQLYEAPPPPETATSGRGPGPGTPAGTGISAAYRAVSLAGEPSAPLAERIPMTEELPVISEEGPAPGVWPTPSPPPPGRALVPELPQQPPSQPLASEPAPSLAQMFMYEPVQAVPPWYAPPAYAPPVPEPMAPEPVMPEPPAYASPPYDSPPYGTGTSGTPAQGPATGTGFDFPPYPARSPGAAPPNNPESSAPPGYPAPAAAQYGAADSPYAPPPSPYDTGRSGAYDDTTQAMPGPLFPPRAGEPWNSPAGDRP